MLLALNIHWDVSWIFIETSVGPSLRLSWCGSSRSLIHPIVNLRHAYILVYQVWNQHSSENSTIGNNTFNSQWYIWVSWNDENGTHELFWISVYQHCTILLTAVYASKELTWSNERCRCNETDWCSCFDTHKSSTASSKNHYSWMWYVRQQSRLRCQRERNRCFETRITANELRIVLLQ